MRSREATIQFEKDSVAAVSTRGLIEQYGQYAWKMGRGEMAYDSAEQEHVARMFLLTQTELMHRMNVPREKGARCKGKGCQGN